MNKPKADNDPGGTVRFGEFALDAGSGELRKNGGGQGRKRMALHNTRAPG